MTTGRLFQGIASGRRIARYAALWGVLIPFTGTAGEGGSQHCVAQHYEVTPIPLRPASINSTGEVAGTTDAHRAALWSRTKGLRELPLPTGFPNSEAVSINDSGHVLIIAYDRTMAGHQSYLFADGTLTQLTGASSHGTVINNSNEIVGDAVILGSPRAEPVYWIKNVMRRIGGCCGGSASGVNNRGNIIGEAYDEKGRYRAFLWTRGQGLNWIGPPDGYSSSILVNDQDDVVVQAFSAVFLYHAGSLHRIELSPKFANHPRAMNNCGAIVGSFGPYSDADRAFLWEQSVGFQDLNSRIAADSGWELEAASGINARGNIVGRGDYRGDDDRGFLLAPKP